MIVYRIVKNIKRADDLSGIGAFQRGGRWNNKGVYMLYASENSSLAFLENLVYFDDEDVPKKLYIMFIEFNIPGKLICKLPDNDYPDNWLAVNGLKSRSVGDKLMSEKKHLVIKVKSKVNPYEYNYLLNPLFPGYYDMVKVISVDELPIDSRLINK